MTNNTMHAVYSKEHEGFVINPLGSLSVPWWGGGIGLQSGAYREHFGQLKPAYMGHTADPCQNNHTKRPVEPGSEKVTAQFNISSDDDKISTKGDKTQVQTANPGMHGTSRDYCHFELGFGQPVVCAKFPYEKQCYGVYSTFGPQVIEGRIMLPLDLTNDEGPIFVNAKQYHGIIRRRQSRAKAELKNKLAKRRKPFLHLSRHLHAMRRPRGCGGRFLNTKSLDASKVTIDKKKIDEGQIFQPARSQNSEVVQTDGGGNMNSPKETNSERSTNSGSEVTSLSSTLDFNIFPMNGNNFWTSHQLLPSMMSAGHRIVLPSKWVAAADGCFNLKA